MSIDLASGLIEAALRSAFGLLERRLAAVVQSIAVGGQIPRSDALAVTRARSALDEIQRSTLGSVLTEALGRKRTALEAIAAGVLEQAAGLGLPTVFTDSSRTIMDALMNLSDRQIREFAGDATEEAARYLMQTVISGGPADALLSKIARTMEIRTDQARTVAEVVVAGFERQLTTSHAQESGIDLFAYLGPDDGITRDWCSHWVGRMGTPEEFEATAEQWGREKQPMPVMAYGGGYNCRHTFVPVVTASQRARFERGPA